MSVTHMMIHKRADKCRDRVNMTHSFPCLPTGTTAVEARRGMVGHDVEVARRPPLARIEQMGRPDGLDALGARARDLWVPVHLGGGPVRKPCERLSAFLQTGRMGLGVTQPRATTS